MKTYSKFVIGMIMVLLLTGCKDNNHNESGTLSDQMGTTDASTETSNNSNSHDGAQKEIESIVCDSDAFDVLLAMAEPFYEDDNYVYSFGEPISKYVTVTFTDGSTENVKEALKNEHIAITDLDTYDIDYYADPKHIHQIMDETETGEYVAENAPEEFYRDEDNIYYFHSVKSQHVIIWYRDGTKQNVKEALSTGKIRITDLDQYGIEYFKYVFPKHES